MSEEKKYHVAGVCCAHEESAVRKTLDAAVGTEQYRFNVLTSELSLLRAEDERAAIEHLHKAGFEVQRKQNLQEESFRRKHAHAVNTGVAGVIGLSGIILDQMAVAPAPARVLLLMAIVVGGWRIFLKAFKSARNLSLDMNVLMTVAVAGALAIGKWSEGAAVIVLFDLSLALESYSVGRTRREIRALMKLAPDLAAVLRYGVETQVSAREVLPGELIVVRPGERIPLDGIVVEGSSTVNEAPITGEALPNVKTTSSQVFAGSINQRGLLRVRVTKKFDDTTLARIIHLVEEAQQKKAPVQHFVERFARIYTPAVFGIAVAVAVIPPMVLGESFGDWFYRALVLLVIACPCALVISTPVTIVSALTAAARRGILVKGGKYLEVLSRVRAIAFDKTGTLTQGKPVVTDVLPLNSMSRTEILQLIATIEHNSEHHIAAAILDEATQHAVRYDAATVERFEAIPGFGVEAVIDGIVYYLGSRELCEQRGLCPADVKAIVERLSSERKTAVILGREQEPLAVIGIQDAARTQGRHAIEHLRTMGINHMHILSGDNAVSAGALASELGFDHYRAGLLPEDKLQVIEELKKQHGEVAMVGDGINDAPALAASSAGIVMGASGTDAALETADVVLMADDLAKLPVLLRLSRTTMAIIKQNIILTLALKLVFLVLTIGGVATLWMAVLADDGATLLVILNALRILRGGTEE